MRYLKYIILSLITSILAVSCLDELSDPQSMAGNDEVTLVPRVRNFTNQYVTKADGDWEKETKITSLVVLVFNNDGILIYKREGTSDLSLNKSMLNTTAQKDKLTEATVVMIANMSLDILKDSEGETMNDNIKNLTQHRLNLPFSD